MMLTVNPDMLPKIIFAKTLLKCGGWGHDLVPKPVHLLVLVKSGRIRIRTNEKEFTLGKDDILLIPKNTPYALQSDVDFMHTVIHFDADICTRSKTPSDGCFSVPQYMKAPRAVCLEIEQVANRQGSVIDEAAGRLSLLHALLGMSRPCGTPCEGALVTKIRAYLSEHLKDGVTLSDIASFFGYSKQYIIRVFKSQTGITPIAALNDMRLALAEDELSLTESSVADVARLCGYDDYNYFSRLFKRKYGISPNKYRQSHFVI